ncbi:MAG: 2-octaprenyl-6-methoxyphenyl hydroxylase [Proteobacteria bacterium]|nr:2-octaprenyl-6-methoxyphenyl hydroxylase [Pseudomonadota bacterium]
MNPTGTGASVRTDTPVVRADTPVDVAIVGGGLVGASLAVALAPLPLRVALIEAVAHDAPDQPSFDERTTALSNASRRIFETLNLWPQISASATPIARIHVSDRGRFGFARIEAARQNLPALGYVVPNRALGRALWSAIQAHAALQVHVPAQVREVRRADDRVRIEIESGGARGGLSARLLVAADGAASRVREALGVEARVRDYHQTALITTVLPQQFHAHTAYERFTTQGPLALLPMSDGRCTAVLTLAAERVAEAMRWDDGAYLAELQSRFGFRLGRFLKCGPRVAYPLALTQAQATSTDRCIVMGNAAQTLHPVAGMGFNLGLRDAACLAELLAQRAGGDCGEADLLRAYDDWRARDRRGVIGFTDSLVRTFSSPLAPLGLLRNAGLLAFDLLPPAKAALSRIASGTARASRLARGVPLA